MKVTVKEKTENEIDFLVVGQLLISKSKGRIIITDGSKFEDLSFSGFCISSDDDEDTFQKTYRTDWIQKNFKKFNGTITIEQ